MEYAYKERIGCVKIPLARKPKNFAHELHEFSRMMSYWGNGGLGKDEVGKVGS
jgi:hypothetical protein